MEAKLKYNPNGWEKVLEEDYWRDAKQNGLTDDPELVEKFYRDFNEWAWHDYFKSRRGQSDRAVDQIFDKYADIAYELTDDVSDEFLSTLYEMVYEGVF